MESTISKNDFLSYIDKFLNSTEAPTCVPKFFCAGTGIPDKICIDYRASSGITIVARNGDLYKNGTKLK